MTYTLYSIRNWDQNFENNRTRDLKRMDWVPISNKHDGDGYSALLSFDDGPALYGAWVVLLQIASKCHPRGILIRDTQIPHTAESLARMARFPVAIMIRLIPIILDIGWLSSIPYENNGTIPQEGAGIPQEGAVPPPPPTAGRCGEVPMEGKGMEGKEEGANAPVTLSSRKFKKPSIEECRAGACDVGMPALEGDCFYRFYESKGWQIGKSTMKNWMSAMHSWKLRKDAKHQPKVRMPDLYPGDGRSQL